MYWFYLNIYKGQTKKSTPMIFKDIDYKILTFKIQSQQNTIGTVVSHGQLGYIKGYISGYVKSRFIGTELHLIFMTSYWNY